MSTIFQKDLLSSIMRSTPFAGLGLESALLQALLFSTALAGGQAPTTTVTPSPWDTTLFKDDFNGAAGTLPDQSNWILQTGTSYPGGPANWGNGESETYTNSTQNVRLDGNGNLLIVPLKSAAGAWTSARIETRLSTYTAPAGGKMKIEASIRLPNTTTANGAG